MNQLEKIPNIGLILGKNDKKHNLYIHDNNRLKHLVVLGMKGTGKSSYVMPTYGKQDIENKKVGSTFICADKQSSMLLYAMAKRVNRNVIIIKPSLTLSGQKLLSLTDYDYNSINQSILDYEDAIKRKKVVIIDMEFAINQEEAIQAVNVILYHLQKAMVRIKDGNQPKHYLYVDDAYKYMTVLKSHLANGKDYGIGCILFVDSREQLSQSEKNVVDSFVNNTILMHNLSLNDAKHYAEDIYEKEIMQIRNRRYTDFIYSIVDGKDYKRTAGSGKFEYLDEELVKSLRLSITRYRGSIRKEEELLEEFKKEDDKASINQPVRISHKNCENKKIVSEKNKVKSMIKHSRKHVVTLDSIFDDEEEY